MIKEPAYLKFIKPGFLTSVQDGGRKAMAGYGIPYSGAMDQLSYNKANQLLLNPKEAACLEMSLIGPEVEFESATQVVVTGALCKVYHNRLEVPMGKILNVKSGDSIKIGAFIKGQWCYMGVRGGIESAKILDSRSWYQGITPQTKIKKYDRLVYLSDEITFEPQHAHVRIDTAWFETNEIGVYAGPEWDLFAEKHQSALFSQLFTVSEIQNRMGIQLLETFENQMEEILTAPVYPGTVQLTPSGKIIILMRDAQVTGGYPRILNVTEEDLNILSQKKPYQKIKFRMISNP